MNLRRTISYFGGQEDANGVPIPWFRYLVEAKSGPREGWGIASIMSLSGANVGAAPQAPPHTILAKAGGPEVALKKSEEFLDRQHPRLEKAASDPEKSIAQPGQS
jgi:hypothetical protein